MLLSTETSMQQCVIAIVPLYMSVLVLSTWDLHRSWWSWLGRGRSWSGRRRPASQWSDCELLRGCASPQWLPETRTKHQSVSKEETYSVNKYTPAVQPHTLTKLRCNWFKIAAFKLGVRAFRGLVFSLAAVHTFRANHVPWWGLTLATVFSKCWSGRNFG